MRGCWLPDELLVGWERYLLSGVQEPVRVGGRLFWNRDRVPRGTLRALCWARFAALRPSD
jgi:hypothetical protein